MEIKPRACSQKQLDSHKWQPDSWQSNW